MQQQNNLKLTSINVLLFLPSSHRAYDIISLALFLSKKGLNVSFMSSSPKGEIHAFIEKNNISTYSMELENLSYRNYLIASIRIAKFVKKEDIDCIISNNLQGNFITALSKLFHRKRTILVRHYSDYVSLNKNKYAQLQQHFISKLGKEFIAISDKVKKQMIYEKIASDKIHRINLGFDFSLFPHPQSSKVQSLKNDHQNTVKLSVIARLISIKRHMQLFLVIKELIKTNINVVLWVVGDGPLKIELVEWVKTNNLSNNIIFFGYVEDSENYIKASDLVVHISKSEASSHVIREAAIIGTPILTCRNVGDADNYIEDLKNGFLIDKEFNTNQLTDKIIDISSNLKRNKNIGNALKNTIIERFNIVKTGNEFYNLITNG